MKQFRTIIILGIIAAGIVFTIVYVRNKSKQEPVVYDTKQAFTTEIIRKTVATGAIVPREEVEIKPKISGIIEEIFVEAGEPIKKGDRIARIQVVPDMLSLANAEDRVKQAKIVLADAQKEIDRQKALLDKELITPIEFQGYELSLSRAKQELSAAEDNLSLIKKGASKSSSSNSNIIIRSTITGMILDIPVKEGTSVIQSNNFNDGTTVASVADMKEMIFEGILDESEVGKVKEGMPLALTIGAIPNVTFDAELEYIAPKGVEDNGAINFAIKAKVKLRKDVFLRAGYSANADIILERKEKVFAINEALIQFDENKKPYVEVETGKQQFQKKYIETGLSDGINIEIKKGITKADQIKVWDIIK